MAKTGTSDLHTYIETDTILDLLGPNKVDNDWDNQSGEETAGSSSSVDLKWLDTAATSSSDTATIKVV